MKFDIRFVRNILFVLYNFILGFVNQNDILVKSQIKTKHANPYSIMNGFGVDISNDLIRLVVPVAAVLITNVATLYKAQILTGLENFSHIWGSAVLTQKRDNR